MDGYNEEIKIDTIVKKISKIPDFKDFYFLSLHFHGDLESRDYDTTFIFRLEEERKKQKPRYKETSPIPNQKEPSKPNSFFNKTGGGKTKTRKKRKSKASKKTYKIRTLKRKRR